MKDKGNKELLRIENVDISFMMQGRKVDAVRDVSLSVCAGEVMALVGESGCGKTALCRAIMGLHSEHAHTSGKILLAEKSAGDDQPEMLDREVVIASDPGNTDFYVDLAQLNDREMRKIRGSRIAMVMQDPMSSLDPTYPIGRQIAESILLGKKNDVARKNELAVRDGVQASGKKQAMVKAIELLGQVGIDEPEKRARQYPHHFSGGMRQRVCIASALALDPDILICDEVTTALDIGTQEKILELLIELQKKKGMTMIFVTHDLGLVEKIADRVCVMQAGRIVEEGSAEEVMKRPGNDYTRELLHYADYGKGAGHTHGELHFHGGAAHSHPQQERDPIVTIDDLNKSFSVGKNRRSDIRDKQNDDSQSDTGRGQEKTIAVRKVINDFSLKIGEGEIVGLVGPSGCGKSTLARCIMGLQKPDSGRISFREGTNAQIIFQDSAAAFNERMTIADIITEPLVIMPQRKKVKQHGDDGTQMRARNNKITAYEGSKRRRSDKISDRLEVSLRMVMEQCELPYELAKRHPYEVSGGQRQRAAIARALITDPDFLIADEPLSSLDVSVQAQIVHLLKRLSEQRGLAILLIAHDLPMVSHVADRVVEMDK